MATYNPVLNTGPSNPQILFGSQATPVNPTLGQIPNSTIPGLANIKGNASNIVQSLTGGLPSAGPTQTANAYFGVTSGMPNSDFVRNRGYDLYGQKAEAYKQRGLDDFLKLLSTYSGTLMPTTGQNIETQQYNRDLDLKRREALANEYSRQSNADFAQKQWGAGRPWTSTNEGQVYDRLGKRLGYEPQYNRGILM